MKAVWMADLHVGSRWALANPDETPKHCPGKEIQRRLFAEWVRAADGPWRRPDALVLVGDAIDGQGPKEGGVHQWTTDIDEQVVHCAELVEMWKPKKVYVIGGSKYHVQIGESGMSGEELLGRKVGAVEYPHQEHIPAERRRRSGPHWFLTFEGTTVHFAHHVSVSRVFHYMSTPVAREMMHAKLNDPMRREWERMYRDEPDPQAAIKKLATTAEAFKTRIVVRAHAHYYWLCDAGGSVGLCLPAWKCPDPWILAKSSLGFGHLGFVGAEFGRGQYRLEKNLIRIEDVQRPPHSIV
jgi:hypothetical protein